MMTPLFVPEPSFFHWTMELLYGKLINGSSYFEWYFLISSWTRIVDTQNHLLPIGTQKTYRYTLCVAPLSVSQVFRNPIHSGRGHNPIHTYIVVQFFRPFLNLLQTPNERRGKPLTGPKVEKNTQKLPGVSYPKWWVFWNPVTQT